MRKEVNYEEKGNNSRRIEEVAPRQKGNFRMRTPLLSPPFEQHAGNNG